MSAMTVTMKIGAISDIIRLRKQYGTLLLLCPTLWALVIASGGVPEVRFVIIFVVGSFLMRSAGCVVNDMVDRDFDRHVERTKTRPLADGRLSLKEAFLVMLVFSLLAFFLVLTLNRLTIILSFVGLALALVYPFVKRVSHLPQAFLGIAFGWGALMAWSAVTGTVGLPAILIFLANVLWSTAYDTIYALMDIDDDLKIGVKSTAILFGKRVYGILFVLYALMAVILALAGASAGLGAIYYIGIIASFILFILILSDVRRNPTRAVALRGFILNAVVGAIFIGFILVDTLL